MAVGIEINVHDDFYLIINECLTLWSARSTLIITWSTSPFVRAIVIPSRAIFIRTENKIKRQLIYSVLWMSGVFLAAADCPAPET